MAVNLSTWRNWVLQPLQLRVHHRHTSSCGSSSRLLCCSLANEASAHEPTALLGRHELKLSLRKALQGVNRGIFGVPISQKAGIENWIRLLECQNPTVRPTEHLQKVEGEWRLLYSTISILGLKRTKLGLRDFVTLGDFLQKIDLEKGRAANIITFSVAGLGMLSGALTIEASYVVSSAT